MPIDKLLNLIDASEPTGKTFEDAKPSFKSKSKTIREIRRENYEADKIIRSLDLTFDPEKDYYEPKTNVDAFNNNYIQYESIEDKDKGLTIKKYLDMIRPFLNDMVNGHKTQGEWKIQLIIVINFIHSKDSDWTCTMHAKSDNRNYDR